MKEGRIVNHDAHLDIIEQYWRPVGTWSHVVASATINAAGERELFDTSAFKVDAELIRITARDGRHLAVILKAGHRLFSDAGEFQPVGPNDIVAVLRWRGGVA